MKTQNTKKLFSFILIFIGMFSAITDAQIVYTDVNPDVTSTGTYNLDLDNDGSTDFVIKHTSSNENSRQCSGSQTNNYFKVSPSGNNAVAQTYYSYNTSYFVTNMAVYATIDATTSTWSTSHSQPMASITWYCGGYPYSSGYFWQQSGSGAFGGGDGLMALKIISGGNIYYGWLRITISGSSFTVKDYAYNSTPRLAILAGQVSENYSTASTIASGPYCAGGNVNVPFNIYGTFNASNIVTAELSNANGSFASPVAIGSLVSNISGNISATIPANTPQGNYYRVRVTTSNPSRISYPSPSYVAVTTLLPSGSITASGSTNLCEGNVAINIINGNYGFIYQWKLNGSNIAGATNSSYYAGAAGDYSCRISTACSSITSNAVTVTSSPVDAPVITAFGPTTICSGSAINLRNTGGYNNTYQWKHNGNNILNATSHDYYYNAQASGDYTCVRTNACGSLTSNAITVTVNPLPPAVVNTAYTGPVCTGPVTLNANTGSGLTYQWKMGNNNGGLSDIPGATNSSYDATVTAWGYSVNVTNSYGCTQSSQLVSSVIIGMNVFMSNCCGFFICTGNNSSPVDMTAVLYDGSPNLYYGGGPYLYQWYKDGVVIAGATNATYSTQTAASYSVQMTRIANGCSGISSPYPVTKGHCSYRIGEYETGNVTSITSIFPNPVSNSTIITFSLSESQRASLKIFDMSGRLVSILADGKYEAGENEIVWNAEYVKSGVYFLQFQTEENRRTVKIIVTK